MTVSPDPTSRLLADLHKIDQNVGIKTITEYGKRVVLLLDHNPNVELASAVDLAGYRLSYLLGVLQAVGNEALVRVVGQVAYDTARNRP